jgi:hypothetical protein
LRSFAVVVTALACISLPGARAGATDFEQTLDLAASPVELRVHSASAAPGSSAPVAGEGSIGAKLPGDGQLTLRVPYLMGSRPVLGDSQLAAGYELLAERELLPKISVTAQLDLPTARGSSAAHPGMKATVAKKLRAGVIRAVYVESELHTNGRDLATSYRTAVGTSFQLPLATTGNFDFAMVRPPIGSGVPRDDTAQLGLSWALGAGSSLHLGVGAGLSTGVPSLRSNLGIDLHF